MPLGGRTEKRIPLTVPVYLVSTKELRVVEKALTENVSPHGARVATKQHWQPGEQTRLSRLTGDHQLSGRVVYCQRLTRGRFCVGLEFRLGPIAWEKAPGAAG
jgi:PilZ domain-containing protein